MRLFLFVGDKCVSLEGALGLRCEVRTTASSSARSPSAVSESRVSSNQKRPRATLCRAQAHVFAQSQREKGRTLSVAGAAAVSPWFSSLYSCL